MAKERVQKILARAGFGSRRACEELIRQGRVTVNGEIITLGAKADPERDDIRVDGERVRANREHVYVILYKPRGVLSAVERQPGDNRRTVRDLVPLDGHIYPVGRLDLNSEGLMLLTDDGDLAHKLTHPRYGHTKTYHVLVEGVPNRKTLERWRRGIILDGRKTAPCQVKLLTDDKKVAWLRVVMREGRKRQIRRVAAALGHPVRRLIRTHIGPIGLGRLKPGRWRHLTPDEVRRLKKAVRTGK